MTNRVKTARRHLDKALQDAGVNFTTELEFTIHGYNLTFRQGTRTWKVDRVPLEVLEDEGAPQLEALVDRARHELQGQGGQS